MISRRQLTFGISSLMLLGPTYANNRSKINLFKGRGCGCCSAWAVLLKSDGFSVTEEEMFPSDLARLKFQKGIPKALASCHTAEISGYTIEGHVPPADIKRILAEKPDAIGLSVPGMPYGSPGMGPENKREAHDVILILRDGRSEIFASYQAGSAS